MKVDSKLGYFYIPLRWVNLAIKNEDFLHRCEPSLCVSYVVRSLSAPNLLRGFVAEFWWLWRAWHAGAIS